MRTPFPRPIGLALLLLAALPLLGCPYGADAPIDPVAAPLDTRLLGRWRCVSGDSEEVGVVQFKSVSSAKDVYDISFLPCDGSDCSFTAHLTMVGGIPMLNARENKKAGEAGDWSFARYTLYRPDLVHFELVREEPFKGVPETSVAIRHVLEEQMGRPELFEDWMSCVRVKEAEASSAQKPSP
jgi:hypothetical protein